MQELVQFLPLIAIVLIFWLLIIRPQARRQRELVRMQSSLEVGNHVVLTSGIHGVLVGTDDTTLRLEVAPGVTITVARGAVGHVVDAEPRETGAEES